jgi:hypothetical protein
MKPGACLCRSSYYDPPHGLKADPAGGRLRRPSSPRQRREGITGIALPFPYP